MGSLLSFGAAPRTARLPPPSSRPAVNDAASSATPADLVRRIQEGDGTAEEELVATYGEGLAFVLRRWTRDREAADDLYQETLGRALEKLRSGELRNAASLPSFLRGLAWNLCIDHYRRRTARGGREAPLGDHVDPPDPGAGQLASLLRREKAEVVRRLLAELPAARDRQVLTRFYLEEQDKERIRADLGLSPAELNMVLFRARRRCQALFEAAFGARARERD